MTDEERQTHKGHEIVVRHGPAHGISGTSESPGVSEVEPALYIDDEDVYTIRNSSGMYIAAGFAFDPQDSLMDLGKRIVDYRNSVEVKETRGHSEEPGEPDAN